eukprot:gene8313-11268_t
MAGRPRLAPAAGRIAKLGAYSDSRGRCNPASRLAPRAQATDKGNVMDGIMLPVTLMAAGGSALIAFWLALRTGGARRAAKVSIGDGGDMTLIARMRAQANFTEYTPFIVILIGLIEL